MKIMRGKFQSSFRIRVLPSIEYTNFAKHSLAHIYGCKYEVAFKWLHYYIYFEFGGVK